MQTEPDVLTEHNELICSTSIERVVTGRDAALLQIEPLIQQLDAISRLTSEVGGGTAQDWAMKAGHRYYSWLTEKMDKAISAITRNIDRSIWRDLMLKSGIDGCSARDEWNKNLEEDELPAISEENILSTFWQLQHSKAAVFERGIIKVFKGLSWDYKSNNPCSFGKKIIVSNLVDHNNWGFRLNWGWRRDQLADLERMLNLLDCKAIPENRDDVTARLGEHISQQRTSKVFEDEYFSIRYFQKGSGHIMFKRPELIERMNDIIAKHYPGMLAQR